MDIGLFFKALEDRTVIRFGFCSDREVCQTADRDCFRKREGQIFQIDLSSGSSGSAAVTITSASGKKRSAHTEGQKTNGTFFY